MLDDQFAEGTGGVELMERQSQDASPGSTFEAGFSRYPDSDTARMGGTGRIA